MTRTDTTQHRRFALRSALRFGVAALAVNMLSIGAAYATVLDSYISVPGVKGDAKIPAYQKWVKFNASYWKRQGGGGFGGGGRGGIGNTFSGPNAPLKGEGTLVVALDKHSPALAKLMDMCAKKAVIPELSYAENSELNRTSLEIGPKPASVPDYFEYKLSDVTVSDCPVLADAPEQGFVLTFKNVQWLNYQPPAQTVAMAGAAGMGGGAAAPAGGAPARAAGAAPGAGGAAGAAGGAGGAARAGGGGAGRAGAVPAVSTATPTVLTPAVLRPAQTSGETRTYVVQWYGYAHDISEDQCPKSLEKPTPEDYYKFMTPEAATLEKARLGARGPTDFCPRGPDKLDVCRLPGVVPDPVQPEPQTKLARGINLDGDDGTGAPPPGIRKHKNFVAADGRTGIDNQLYVVEGCMRGVMGHLGQSMQYANESRKNGSLAIMLQISGIDDAKNDDNVDVTLFYSMDKMAKSGDGNAILADYTFRVTDNLRFTHAFKRWHGRIVNGVVITDADPEPLKTNLNEDLSTTLYQPTLRLEFMPDRSLKGVLGGYQDWRKIVNAEGASLQETLFGSSVPAMYNALKRNADGMYNKVTGEYDGISSAYDIEAVPAFVIPDANKSVLASAETEGRQAR